MTAPPDDSDPADRASVIASWQAAAEWVAGQLAEVRRIEAATNPRMRDPAIRRRFDRPDPLDSS